MKIAFVASEAVPFAKTGGLGDVAGSLPKALEKLGCEVKLFVPKYLQIDETKNNLHYNWDIGEIPISIAGQVRSVHLQQAVLPDSNVQVYFLDCPHYYHRDHFYTNHPDEDERFILLCKGVIESLQRLKWIPNVIHCNDWQTGLLPIYIKDNYSWDKIFNHTATLFTIHNIGYQGRFPADALLKAGIRDDYFLDNGPVEIDKTFCFMKAGISFSDIINTVSKTYAREILSPEYGAGMNVVLNSRKEDLYGIINGVDYDLWNPEIDTFIPFRYSMHHLGGKLENKKFLLEHVKLSFNERLPVIGIISRMVAQKGFDIFADAIDELIKLPAQWVILGSGEDKYETLFHTIAQGFPERVFAYTGYNNELSHLIEAASDMLLMPSHYEPCGLSQIYSLKYGTVPIVRKTGGLADTVQDWNEYLRSDKETGTGFSFEDYSGFSLFTAVKRAIAAFNDKETWKKIQINGMGKSYSWESSAKEYIKLYEMAIAKRA